MVVVGESLHSACVAVLHASLARGLTPAQWLTLTHEAASTVASSRASSSSALSIEDLGSAVCDALLALVASLPPFSPRLHSYLVHALAVTPPLVSSTEAVLSMARLVKATPIDQRTVVLPSLDAVATPLLASQPPASLSTRSPRVALERLRLVAPLVDACRSLPPAHSLLILVPTLLLSLVSSILSFSSKQLDSVATLKASVVDDISSPQLLLAYPLLSRILRHLDPTLARRLTFDAAGSSEFNSYSLPPPPSATALVTHLAATPGACARTEEAVARIATYAQGRHSQHRWLTELLCPVVVVSASAAQDIREENEASGVNEDAATTNVDGDVVWDAFLAGGRLVQLLQATLESGYVKESDKLDANDIEFLKHVHLTKRKIVVNDESTTLESIMQIEASTDKKFEVDDDVSRVALWNTFLTLLFTHSLVSPNVEPPLDLVDLVQVPDPLPHYLAIFSELIESLPNQSTKLVPISTFCQDVIDTLVACSQEGGNRDLNTMCCIIKALGNGDVLAVMFLFVEPRSLIEPVRQVLDNWGGTVVGSGNANTPVGVATATATTGQEETVTSGAPSSGGEGGEDFEKFGLLLGWIHSVVIRFDLIQDFSHLGTQQGFTAHYLASPSSCFALSSLPLDWSTTLSAWLEALYGSSGISDDVLSMTDIRVLVRLAPTLFRQSFEALKIGIVDVEGVREGLSYFEQELLGGCAFGVMSWMIDELTRLGPTVTIVHSAILEILQTMLLSKTVAPLAIESIAGRALSLIRRFTTEESGSFSGRPPLSSGGTLDVTRLEEKLTSLPIPPLPRLCNLNGSKMNLLTSSGGNGWQDALKTSILSTLGHGGNGVESIWSLLPKLNEALVTSQFISIVSESCRHTSRPFSPSTNHEGSSSSGGSEWNVESYLRLDRTIDLMTSLFCYNVSIASTVVERFVVEWNQRLMYRSREEIELELEVLVQCLKWIKRFETICRQVLGNVWSSSGKSSDELIEMAKGILDQNEV